MNVDLTKLTWSAFNIFSLSTRQKSQQPLKLPKLVGEVEQDMADEIEALSKEGLKRSAESFLKGIGCS
jgi:hypothetical protein